MNNFDALKITTTSGFNSPFLPQIINKLSGDNLTTIIVSAFVMFTVCYVSNNSGNLEVSSGDKKIVLSSCGSVS